MAQVWIDENGDTQTPDVILIGDGLQLVDDGDGVFVIEATE